MPSNVIYIPFLTPHVQCLPYNVRIPIIDLSIPHVTKNDHIIFNFDSVMTVSHAQTVVVVSRFHNNRLYQSTAPRNMCIS